MPISGNQVSIFFGPFQRSRFIFESKRWKKKSNPNDLFTKIESTISSNRLKSNRPLRMPAIERSTILPKPYQKPNHETNRKLFGSLYINNKFVWNFIWKSAIECSFCVVGHSDHKTKIINCWESIIKSTEILWIYGLTINWDIGSVNK